MSTLSQMFPPSPAFTERELGSLLGKVVIITGASSGIGLELAKMLYSEDATVYLAARSSDKLKKASSNIRAEIPTSKGKIVSLLLDLADLSSIKKSADEFLAQESRLDVLVHNAGVMTPPAGSKTKLGHDLEMGTNCLGPFLFNYFLEQILKRTAKQATEPGSVRILWLTSFVSVFTPQGGIVFDEMTGSPKVLKNTSENYMESKAGNVFLASVTAQRLARDGVISISVNPGIIKTELQRHLNAIQITIIKTVFKGAKFGAYSELFAGFSPAIKIEDSGRFIIPWGRFGVIPDHIAKGLKTKSEGGTGAAQRFWDWCKQETAIYQGGVSVGKPES